MDVAAAQGRLAIYASDPSSAEWATPVLFMRVSDGRLFSFPGESSGMAADAAEEKKTLLDRYLQWLIEQYTELELPALGANTPSRVPLETVYVALRGDLSSPDERLVSQALLEEEARRLEDLAEVQELSPEQRFRYVYRLVALIARNPLPLSIEERDRPHLYRPAEDRIVSLGEAFQRERRMVILGDPGSGKTTLVRWLTLQLARAWQTKRSLEDRVFVPAHQVDPSAPEGSPDLDLGPVRVPILVRVASFAAACQENSGLALSTYLGRHLGSAQDRKVSLAKGEEIDPEALNALLLGLLDTGRAVVLIDGLDEIGDHEVRRVVAHKIDQFFDVWLRDSLSLPVRDGGNQMIATSRIVGYKMAPLRQEAAHLTIEPMRAEAIARFCDVWVKAVPPPGPAEGAEERARQEVEGLKRALADLQERGAGDLSGNPLLLTILALVYRSGQSTFPRQRVKLYETAVRILLDTWRRRARAKGGKGLEDEEVLAALVPLAAEIHESSAAGVVEEKRLEQILRQHLDPAEVRPFLALVEEDVGLLAARGRQVYGFLHLTFQEYLAAAALIQDRSRVADELLARLGSPRWREPILMALGRLSSDPDPASFGELLLGLLAREDPLDALIPRLPLLIVAALPEMVVVPPGVVEKTASRLLAAYANPGRLERFPTLREQIEGAFSWLSGSSHAGAVERVLCAALRDPSGRDRTPAAARLALACRLYSAEMGEALASALPRDSEAWDWPVDRALRDLAGREPRFLAGDRDTLRRRLLRRPDLAATLTSHPGWRRLCMAVYGGLDSLLPERIAAAQRDVARLKAEREAWNSRTEDPLHDETTARLDKETAEAEARIKALEKEGNALSVERIYRDSPLITPLVFAALSEGAPTPAFVEKLRKVWRSDGEPDALLALAALGEAVLELLSDGSSASHAVVSRLPHLIESIRPAVAAALPPAVTALGGLAGACPAEHWSDLVAAMARVSLEIADRPLQVIDLRQKAPPQALPLVLAEMWSYMLSGANEDSLYNMAVTLDTQGASLSDPPQLLAGALATCPRAVGVHWDHHGWALERLAPRPTNLVEALAASLDALAAIPEPFDFVRGWALCRLAPLLRENGLLLEAFLLALETLSDRFDARADALAELTREEPHLATLIADPYPWLALRGLARHVRDPYLRFRVYDQLSRALPDIRAVLLDVANPANAGVGEPGPWKRLLSLLSESAATPLSEGAEEAAQAISQPGQRAAAFERLAAMGNESQRKRWIEQACRAALRIEDRANRAVVLVRLSIYLPPPVARGILTRALEDVAAIADPRQRAELLAELSPSLHSSGAFEAELRQAILGLGDPWLAALALRRIAPPLLVYESTLASDPVDMAPIALGAVAADLRRELALPSDLGGLWSALAGPLRTAALEELRRRFHPSGLRLTPAAAAALDQLLESGEPEIFRELVALVDHPEESVLPLLEEWRELPAVRRQIDLLLAETGELSERTIPTLLELLADPEDRLGYRAAIALHGDKSEGEKRLTTSGLGMEAVALLAREALARREIQPQVVQVLVWTFERLRHTDGRALKRWADLVKDELPERREAELILSRTGRVDSNAWPVYRDLLLHGDPRVQSLLLHNLCLLLIRERLPESRWAEVAPQLSALGETQVGEKRFLLNGPGEIVAAAARSRAPGRSDAELAAAADKALEARVRRIGEVLKTERDPAALRRSLAAIGDITIASMRWEQRIAEAAERIEDEPSILDALVAWLSVWLEGDLLDNESFFLKGSDLLGLTAAAAERLPYRFLAAATQRPLLARGLAEAAAHHSTFTGRWASLVLLSCLRRINRHSLSALRAGLRDVADVQEVALQTVERYREIDEGLLPELVRDLRDPSPAVAYATGRMLSTLARNLHLPVVVRQVVAEALAEALEAPECRRDVHVLVRDRNDCIQVEHRGRLDEIFYRLLSEILGTVNVSTPEKS
ncbi:MAG: NACHT domain-containing protein [Acidobacteriota bacterium]